jgi:hypothetical protein
MQYLHTRWYGARYIVRSVKPYALFARVLYFAVCAAHIGLIFMRIKQRRHARTAPAARRAYASCDINARRAYGVPTLKREKYLGQAASNGKSIGNDGVTKKRRRGGGGE